LAWSNQSRQGFSGSVMSECNLAKGQASNDQVRLQSPLAGGNGWWRWITETARRRRLADNRLGANGRTSSRTPLLHYFSPFVWAWFLVRAKRTLTVARDEIRLLRLGAEEVLPARKAVTTPVSNRTFYLVYNSLPFHSAGYATRTHGLVAGLREQGFDTSILTRLGYPRMFTKYQEAKFLEREEIDGVPYLRLDTSVTGLYGKSNRAYIRANIQATLRAISDSRPAIIHGASNFVTGLTAIGVARALGVPSVYEVRGLWEITALSRDPAYGNSLHYAQAVRLETEACLAADKVIAITGALKDELVRRGVPAQKIEVVPNGVDTERFQPRARDAKLSQKLGLRSDHVVVGYVGSILDYEGLDDLLRALRVTIDRGASNLRLLVVGDGAAYQDCLKLSSDLGLQDHAIFTGRIPHHEVEAYYSLIDIAPFARKPLPVCEMVSPLKPFEAMAMGKCVIVSSVAALSEIVGDRPIALVHEKGSIEGLADAIFRLAGDPELRQRIGSAARDFVVTERDWRVLAQRVVHVYESLLADRTQGRRAG